MREGHVYNHSMMGYAGDVRCKYIVGFALLFSEPLARLLCFRK